MIVRGPDELDAVDFTKGGGLVPMVAQDVDTGQVRMLGYADRTALRASLDSGWLHFFSRRRAELWKKGETSGNTLQLVSLHVDCDGDAALALVRPLGPTCHTGAESCFDAAPFLKQLTDVVRQRARTTAAGEESDSYTVKLLRDRNLRLKKLAEEAGELAVACADDDPEEVEAEAADLLYHMLVACQAAGVPFEAVVETLRKRNS